MRKMLQIHGNMFDLEIADAKTLVMTVADSSVIFSWVNAFKWEFQIVHRFTQEEADSQKTMA